MSDRSCTSFNRDCSDERKGSSPPATAPLLSSDGASCVEEKSAKSSKSSIAPEKRQSAEFPRCMEGDGGATIDGENAAADAAAAAVQIAWQRRIDLMGGSWWFHLSSE